MTLLPDDAPGQEIALEEPYTPARVLGGMPYFDQYLVLADRICRTAMVPDASRGKPDQVLAIIMYGAELGIGPMQALQQINFIEGKPATSPELMRALIRQAGHKLSIASTRTSCVIEAERGDTGETGSADFTLDDAVTAGLCTIDENGVVRARSAQGKALPWEKYTKDLLLARATSRIARMMFSDVIAGMSYTPEEVMSFTDVSVHEPVVLASETMQTQIKDGLEKLNPQERKDFAEWWQESGITRGVQNLSPDEAKAVYTRLLAILDESDGVVEAEVVEGEETNLEASLVNPEEMTAPPITQPQIGKIRALIGGQGETSIHTRVSDIVGHQISSLKELTKAEATHVIDQLMSEQ